ncbi:putative membrane protein [Rosellinia necatrix]|uniref:Putative membrane protein n=1 Tax=Rosellinia necatrix TaxID=77044 RepID=A0A1W2TCV1_ROSNE|nr:putative membrane protein [Rosellinia necatrix]
MSSRDRPGERLLRPRSRGDVENASDTEARSVDGREEEPALGRRQASVYDAVAGRVTTTRPIGSHKPQRRSRPRVTHHGRNAPDSRRNPTLAPEEVLFRRAGAPVRYAEKDIYQAHEDLPDGGRGVLPDSDLLKTIHAYASRFYADRRPLAPGTTTTTTAAGLSERSMDETALLAFGVLLEEAGREALGRKGDLVFTEGVVGSEAREGPSPRGGGGGDDDDDDDDDAEAFGFRDAPRHEAHSGRLLQPGSARNRGKSEVKRN